MHAEIRNKPDYSSLHLVLGLGDQVVTEAGAMMGMSPGITLETNMQGGLLAAAKRALGGESLFLNTYTGTAAGQRLDLAPATPGDMEHVAMDGRGLMVQSGSFCACTPGVTLDTKWGGAKSFFGGEGLFMLRCSGRGQLWIATYGAMHIVDVVGAYTVDTSHIVAFEETLTYQVRSLGGIKSLFLSKEGLVCQFSGTGRLWLQTRSAPALASFLHPFRSVRSKPR